jgi:hypothetical protein
VLKGFSIFRGYDNITIGYLLKARFFFFHSTVFLRFCFPSRSNSAGYKVFSSMIKKSVVVPLQFRSKTAQHKSKLISFKKPPKPSDYLKSRATLKIPEDNEDDPEQEDDEVPDENKTLEHLLATLEETSLSEYIEDVRRELQYHFMLSWTGALYKHVMIALAVVSLFVCVVETYHDSVYVRLERVLAALFLWDWCLSAFLANDARTFVTR